MKHVRERRTRNRILRGRSARIGGGGAPLTLRQQTGIVLGVQPQIYADARELGLEDGAPVTAFGPFNQKSGEGTVIYDEDGWGDSLPAVVLPSNGHFFSDDYPEIENYDAYTSHVWVWSFAFGFSASNMTLGGFSADQTNITNRLLLILAHQESTGQRAVFRIRESAQNQDTDVGSGVPIDTLMHLGVCHDGESVTVIALTSDGPETLINAAANSITADIEFNYVHLGGSAGAGQSPAGPMALASYTRCAPEAATPANLIAVLNLHNQHYPVS